MMKCHNCKNEIRDDANFCLHCGTPVLKKEPDTRPMINEVADEKIVIPVVQNEAVRRTPVEPEAAVEETESYTVPAEDTLAESAEAVKLEVPPVIISNSLQVSEEPVKDTSPVIETIPQDEAVCDIPKQVNREDISVGDVPFVTGNEPYAGGVSNRPATEKTEYATYMPPPNPALEEKLAKGAKKRAKLAAKEAKEREKLEAKAAKLRAKFEAKEAKRRAKASKKKHTGLVVFLIILILLLLSSIAVGAWFVHDRGIIDLEEMFPWMPEIPDFPEIGFLIGVLEDEAEEPDEDETEDEDEETDDPDETEEENEPIEKDEKVTYCDAVTDGAFALVDSKSEVMTEDEYEKILKKAKDVSEENEISIILIIDKDIFGDKDEAEKYMIDACDTLFENYSGMMDDYCIFFIDSEQNSCYSMISETAAPDDGDEYKKLLGSFGKNVKEDGYKKAIIKLLDGLSF